MYITNALNSTSHGGTFLFAIDMKVAYLIKLNGVIAAVGKHVANLSALDNWRNSCKMNHPNEKGEVLT